MVRGHTECCSYTAHDFSVSLALACIAALDDKTCCYNAGDMHGLCAMTEYKPAICYLVGLTL